MVLNLKKKGYLINIRIEKKQIRYKSKTQSFEFLCRANKILTSKHQFANIYIVLTIIHIYNITFITSQLSTEISTIHCNHDVIGAHNLKIFTVVLI